MAEPTLPSAAPVRRRRRHCVVVTPTTRRRRRQQLPAPVTMETEDGSGAAGEEYLVEKIIGERFDPRTSRRLFRVRWQGYSPEHDTWEPEANLAGVREFVEAYRRERSDRLRQRLIKRKGKRAEESNRRRMGSWEYVPTSELVAKKTRFFDDLAEGRIDVRSDDLYSRVKCRRRQNGTDDELGEADGPENGERMAEKENVMHERAGRGPKAKEARGRRERSGVQERRGRRPRREQGRWRVVKEEPPPEEREVENEVKKQEELAVQESSLVPNQTQETQSTSGLQEPELPEAKEEEPTLPTNCYSNNSDSSNNSNISTYSNKNCSSSNSSRSSCSNSSNNTNNSSYSDNNNSSCNDNISSSNINSNSSNDNSNSDNNNSNSNHNNISNISNHNSSISNNNSNSSSVGSENGGGQIQRETSSDISPPALSPVTPVSPKSPFSSSRTVSPPETAPKLLSSSEAVATKTFSAPSPVSQGPTLSPQTCEPRPRTGAAKPGRKPRPPHTVQRRRLVQKVSPNMQSTVQPPPPVSVSNVPFLSSGCSSQGSAFPPTACNLPAQPASVGGNHEALPPNYGNGYPQIESAVSVAPQMALAPPPPPPARAPSPAVSTFFQPPAPPPPCLGAPSIRPEILEKMIDDCMSQNHIPDVNPLLSYMVDDAKTPPPALVSVQHEWVDTERELIDSYLQVSSNYNTIGINGGFDAISTLPHLRPQALPCGNAGRVSNVQLRVAILQNNFSLVRALLANSASHPGFGGVYDLEQRDGDGESLLARCVRHGHRHMAELLLQYGGMTESPRRSDGATPLMLAVDAGQYHMSRLLLDYGASSDHQNRAGETCLHRAVRRGHSALVDLLWRRGVDFSRVDVHMQTALKCTRSYPLLPSHPQIERMLVSFLQTHNHQLNLTWTAFLAALNLEAETHLYPPNSFVSVAHCPHNLYRFQLQVPNGPDPNTCGVGGPVSVPLTGAHVLLLVHALADHPSMFWLEDGPCVVESVALNGTEQRRFGHHWFSSSLYPLMTGTANEVEIKLTSDMTSAAQYRNIRLVVIAMKVRPRSLPGPNMTANQQQTFTSAPQLHRSPVGAMPAPAVVASGNQFSHPAMS